MFCFRSEERQLKWAKFRILLFINTTSFLLAVGHSRLGHPRQFPALFHIPWPLVIFTFAHYFDTGALQRKVFIVTTFPLPAGLSIPLFFSSLLFLDVFAVIPVLLRIVFHAPERLRSVIIEARHFEVSVKFSGCKWCMII